MPASKKLGLAIIGTGGMGREHARRLQQEKSCELKAACDLRPAELENFVKDFGIPKGYSDYKELLADPEVEAICVVTPDGLHAEISIAALNAGKHVLCEKPLALNYGEALQMEAAARKSGCVNMVNFVYRNSDALQRAVEIVSSGEIGELLHVEAHYLQSWLSSKVWGDWRSEPSWLWRLSTQHGSKGVLGDVGVHILDMASYPAGPVEKVHCQLATFAKVKGEQQGEYHFDANDSAVMNLVFASGALGSVHCSRWATGHENSLYLGLYGSKGAIKVDLDQSWTAIRLCSSRLRDSAKWETLECEAHPSTYQHFVRACLRHRAEDTRWRNEAGPDFARGAEIQRLLDACFFSAECGRMLELSEIK